ncbi:MAG TPA: carbohydrate ABC transporter permease [Solirubrobacteraceae bacterium]|jgi:multiple sugar transport system permease protein|nr:carbohydrate ABC transporter permease [Solirubrobacteraceae bacterium]
MSAIVSSSAGTEGEAAPKPRRPVHPPAIRRRTFVLSVIAYAITLIFLLPYLEMIVAALRPHDQLLAANLLPTHFTFSNFTTIWATGFGGNLVESLLIAGGATLLVLVVAVPAAYYSARHRFRGRTTFLLLVLATQMLQPAAMLVGIQREFSSFNLPPTLSLVLVNAGFNMAFAVWIMNAYFASIPVELEEAAMIDGASRLGALGRVTLPLAMPGIVTALIFTFIAAWNEFIVALTLSLGESSNHQPLTVAINSYIGEYSIDWGHLFAGSVIATIPVIILFAVIEGRVVSGLTAGSIK